MEYNIQNLLFVKKNCHVILGALMHIRLLLYDLHGVFEILLSASLPVQILT
jgi:hypothetical protein